MGPEGGWVGRVVWDGDDVVYELVVSPVYSSGTSIGLIVVDGPLGSGHYRFSVMPSVRDLVDNGLDGNGDGTGGDAYEHVFDIRLPEGYVFEGRSNESFSSSVPLALAEIGARVLPEPGVWVWVD